MAPKKKAEEAKKKADAPAAAGQQQPEDAKLNDVPSLKGAVLVFTGELDSMTRVEVEHKVKAAGAKVMSNVSGNTDYLVLGSHLDDGRPVEETSKYRKYLELQEKGKKCPKLLREKTLLELLGACGPPPKVAALAAVQARPAGDAPPSTAGRKEELWVDRHAPTKLEELMGNASAVRKLLEWLRDWDNVVLRGQTKAPRFKPGGGMPENINARAALISGPPGIGKTTACRLAVRLHGGYELLEYNASDARGQKVIQAMATGVAQNRTLAFGGASSSTSSSSGGSSSSSSKGLGAATLPALTRRAVIIMDEVDGMGAGDYGGNAALIKMIKNTKNPIICICNDHSSPKVRSLAFSCYDIRFSRPSRSTIAQRALQIAAAEGLAVEENAVEALAESTGNDMRQTLNQLQVMANSPQLRSEGVGYDEMRARIERAAKDRVSTLGPFEACKNLLASSVAARLSLSERLEHFFVDHQLMHLMVHENYLGSVARKPLDAELLSCCARSAELIALGDLFNRRIRDNQEWSLLPSMGIVSTVYPAHLTNGFVAFPEFPKFLGNYSKMSKARRLCQELHSHLRIASGVKRGALAKSGYLDVLHRRIMQPLQNEDVLAATEVLDAYGLHREHVAEHLAELRQHLGEEDEFKLLEPKVKAAMTRELNQGSHAPKVVLPSSKKRRIAAPEADDLGEEADATPQGSGAAAAAGGQEEGKEESDGEGAAGSSLVKKAKPKRGAAGARTAARARPPARAAQEPKPAAPAPEKTKRPAPAAEPKAGAEAARRSIAAKPQAKPPAKPPAQLAAKAAPATKAVAKLKPKAKGKASGAVQAVAKVKAKAKVKPEAKGKAKVLAKVKAKPAPKGKAKGR